MLNIVYFGTSNHSVILLDELIKSKDIDIKLVITKPDKPVGRHQISTPSAVKKWCIENNIPYITPESLKKELKVVSDEIKSVQGDELIQRGQQEPKKQQAQTKPNTNNSLTVGLVADYGLIIPMEIINIFPQGIINIHFSLLPKYRGAAPVTYTILNGDKETGITFLLTVKEMDKGDILEQIPFTITENENDETLYQKLFKVAGEASYDVLKAYLNGDLKPVKQDESKASYTTPNGKFDRTTYILKDDAKIDFAQSPQQIDRCIRAFYPWPVAWTTLGDLQKFVFDKDKTNPTGSSVKPDYEANLRANERAKIKLKIHKTHLEGDLLVIDLIQPEGKNIMDFNSFKNGYLV